MKTADNLPVPTEQNQSLVSIGDYQAMPIATIESQVRSIQQLMSNVMIEDEHHGTVPGCGKKKVLFQSGAQKLNLIFRFRPDISVEEADLGGGHKIYDSIVNIIHIPTGDIVGQGVGTCSTMESKFRYRIAAKVCPRCGVEAIIKGKVEFGGGWVCLKAKDGCGAKFNDTDKEITEQKVGRVEYEDPADYYNTCKKMSVKRAYVAGTLSATAAGDIFTQDLDDDPLATEDEKLRAEMTGNGTKNQSQLNDYMAKLNSFTDQASLIAYKTKNESEIKKALSGQGELFSFNKAYDEKMAEIKPVKNKDGYINDMLLCSSEDQLVEWWQSQTGSVEAKNNLPANEYQEVKDAWIKHREDIKTSAEVIPETPETQPQAETPPENKGNSVEHVKLRASIDFAGEEEYRLALVNCKFHPNKTDIDTLSPSDCVKINQEISRLLTGGE